MIWPSPSLRSVTSGVPSCSRAQTCTSGPSMAGSASTWRLTVTSGGTGVPANRLVSSIGASFCGVDHDSAPPSVRPPTRSGTGSRFVAAVLEARAGEAHEHAALLHPVLDVLGGFARQRADVGQHEHAGVLRQRFLDAGGEVGALRLDQLGVRRQRLLDVVERRQQRLRLLAALAGDERHAVPLRARVDEADGAGRALAGDLDAADLVAQLERQLERNGRRGRAGGEFERRFGEALPARRDGVHEAVARAAAAGAARALRACRSGRCRPTTPSGSRRAAVLDDGEGAALREAAQLVGGLGRLAVVVDVVAQPDDAGAALGAGERRFERAGGGEAVGREGLRGERGGGGARFGRRFDARGESSSPCWPSGR